MLNYFRSKNKLIDKIHIQSVTEEAFLKQIRELEQEKEFLFAKNHELSGDLGKAFSDICDLQGRVIQLEEQIKNDNILYNEQNNGWAEDCSELTDKLEKAIKDYNLLSKDCGDLKRQNRELEAKCLGLLDKIANDNKFHDPDLKIDLNKPIRFKFDKTPRIVWAGENNRYCIKDNNGVLMSNNAGAKYINENYENYEPDVKEVCDIVPEPIEIKEDKYPIGEEKDRFSLSTDTKKEEEHAIIDLTKKSYAVKDFFMSNMLYTDFCYKYSKGQKVFYTLNKIDFKLKNVSKDNIERIVNSWCKDGLVYKKDGFYLAAKPLKIILEKEK